MHRAILVMSSLFRSYPRQVVWRLKTIAVTFLKVRGRFTWYMRFYLKNCKKQKDQLLRAPSSVGRYHATPVNEGRKC